MPNSMICKQCGTALGAECDGESEKRIPCHTCGSTSRDFFLFAEPLQMCLQGIAVTFEIVRNTASLLLQAIITPVAKTFEGQLIEVLEPPWLEIIHLLSNDPSLAYQIKDRKWEEIIAGAYRRAGFDEVTLTPKSGDLGRDVIAVKRGIGTVRIIDQVKAYGPNHLVTANDVRALLGVLQGDKASKGFLTTTSDFAPKLRDDILLKPFIPSRIELINGKSLIARLKELGEKNK